MDNTPDDTKDETIGRLIAAAGPGQTASAQARARVYAAVHSQWQESVRRERSATAQTTGRYRLWGMAASILAAASLFYWLQPGGPVDAPVIELAHFSRIQGEARLVRDGNASPLAASGTAAAVVAGDVLRTGADGLLALELDDNLLIRINVDTELVFTDPETVELRAGTVYIDSGDAGAGLPLEVRTPIGSLAHLGTQYEVHVAGAELRLRVREGSVQFSNTAGASAIGTAGEQLEVGADGRTSRSAIATDDEAWSWASALATLPTADEYALGSTLRWIAREGGLVLEYTDNDTGQRLDRATIVGLGGLTPDETQTVLERTTGIRITVANGRLLVTY